MNAQKQKNWGPLHVLGLKNNDLERISNKNIKRFNRNIVWQTIKQETHIEQANCMVVPILIHQHHNGAVVFPHFRCHIVVDGLSNLLLQDISFEQWVEL
jgi:hypothetical protein